MRFLRLLKRSVLIMVFIIGLAFALWLAFLAKPDSEFIGRANAADLTKPTESKGAPMLTTPRSPIVSSAPKASTFASSARSSANPNIKLSKIIIPVSGVRAEQLYDSFGDGRSEGRVHRAMDIRAQKGTPVLAAADGVIKKISYSERGGKTLYQLSSDGKIVYYYAHLDSYATSEGNAVKQGDVIAYVGDTGNAGAGNYHLHFAMWAVTDPKRLWQGDNINPYPLLH